MPIRKAVLWLIVILVDPGSPVRETMTWSGAALNWNFYELRDEGSGNQVAFSYIGIEYYVLEVNGRPGASFVAIFRPGDSWVKQGAATGSLLVHEQRTFDLAELSARKMRRDIALHIRDQTEDLTVSMLLPEMRRIYKVRLNEMLLKIQQYNVQTFNGTNSKAQQKWNALIDTELAKLNMFRLMEPDE